MHQRDYKKEVSQYFAHKFRLVQDPTDPRAIRFLPLPKGHDVYTQETDGVGTKGLLAQYAGDHRTISHDLFAMVCEDATTKGFEPQSMTITLEANTLGDRQGIYPEIHQLGEGILEAAALAQVKIINGETAVVDTITGHGRFNYSLNGTVMASAPKEKLITGENIREGNIIVALREHGFRSNGFTLVRKILSETFGFDWYSRKQDLLKELLRPSTIYSPTLLKMREYINYAAHITGGGIPDKLGTPLKVRGFGAVLHDLYVPPSVMSFVQRKGDITDEEAYHTWNMGNGILIITDQPEKIIEIATNKGLEAKAVGEVTSSKKLDIESLGAEKLHQNISFNLS